MSNSSSEPTECKLHGGKFIESQCPSCDQIRINFCDTCRDEGTNYCECDVFSPWKPLFTVVGDITPDGKDVYIYACKNKETKKRVYGKCSIYIPNDECPVKVISEKEKFEWTEMQRFYRKKEEIGTYFDDLPLATECADCQSEEGECHAHVRAHRLLKRKQHKLGPIQDEHKLIVEEVFEKISTLKKAMRHDFNYNVNPYGFTQDFLKKLEKKLAKFSKVVGELAAKEPPIASLDDCSDVSFDE